MAYAEIIDIEARIARQLSEKETTICETMLEDATAMIDSYNSDADNEIKKLVCCRMVTRLIDNFDNSVAPAGASQGSISALSYSQSWTMPSGASVGELYFSKEDKRLLGIGRKIGSYSPLEGDRNDKRHRCNTL